MRSVLALTTTVAMLGVGAAPTLRAAAVQVVLATGQTPGDAEVSQVASVAGGIWDRAGRVLMSGRYRPASPGAFERNALWTWNGPNTARELYVDGDSVPYFSMPVTGPVIAMSVPWIQPRLGNYVPPPAYWAFSSAVATRLPDIPESRACWVDKLDRPAGVSPTLFVVNDLESHEDGTTRFVRPEIEAAIVRERASAVGLSNDLYYPTPAGGAVQLYFNASYFDPVSSRGGTVVWIARSDLAPVISGRSNVVRIIAASSGMRLPSLPGGAYSFLRVLGVDPNEHLLWQAAADAGTQVLRGEPGLWTTLIAPGMPAPPARGAAPSVATPLGTVGAVGLVAHGAAVMAEAVYSPSAGDLAGRAALLLHDGHTAKLMAFENELVDGTVPGTRLQRFTPGGYDWPDTNLAAFYGPVRGGTQPFETQALLLAGENNVWLLARQYDPLPVPANIDRIVQFRSSVLAAKPDGTVAFAAEVEFMDGTRREILYSATPGIPNRYQVILSAGDAFPVSTPEGTRIATLRHFNLAQWRPGTFDQLLVSVDLQVDGTSAVILVDPTATPAEARLEAAIVGDHIRIRWPESVTGTLEGAESVAADPWTLVTSPVTVLEGYRQVEMAIEGATRFFRLR